MHMLRQQVPRKTKTPLQLKAMLKKTTINTENGQYSFELQNLQFLCLLNYVVCL